VIYSLMVLTKICYFHSYVMS